MLRHFSMASLLMFLSLNISAEDVSVPLPDVTKPTEAVPADAISEDMAPRKWNVLFSLVNIYPALESESLVKDIYDPLMRILAPGYDNVYTVGDLRDDHVLLAPHIGIGYSITPRWSFCMQGGYSAGTLVSEDTWPSRLLLPLHSHVAITRGGYYVTAGFDFWPLKQVEQKKYAGWGERVRGIRPMIGARYNLNYATFDAKVKIRFKPLPNLIDVKISEAYMLTGIIVNAGFDMPITAYSHMTFEADYNFFQSHEEDFNGPAITIGIKHYF
jgi:hypothetical protein